MTIDEFEKAKRRDLKARANECLAKYEDAGGLDKPYLLLEAQLYMQELDRRHDSWISYRDLILEVVVILLIGWEIWFGSKQDDVLTRLQESTAATTTALMSVQSTSAAMNDAVQQQLGMEKDVAINMTYDQNTNNLIVTNTGKQAFVLTLYRFGQGRGPRFTPAFRLASTESAKISLNPVFRLVDMLNEKSYSTDLTMELSTDNGAYYVATSELSFIRISGDTRVLYSPTYLRLLHGPTFRK
jgi:hypothetical protein